MKRFETKWMEVLIKIDGKPEAITRIMDRAIKASKADECGEFDQIAAEAFLKNAGMKTKLNETAFLTSFRRVLEGQMFMRIECKDKVQKASFEGFARAAAKEPVAIAYKVVADGLAD